MLQYDLVALEDLQEVTRLYEEYLNAGESIRAFIKEGMEAPGYLGVKCTDGKRMVGVMSGRPGVNFTCGHLELVREIEEEFPPERGVMYTFDMLVVEEQYRDYGIARELSKRYGEALREAGVDYIIAELWNVNGDRRAGGIIKYIGETVKRWEFPDFYKDMKAYGMTCPLCGEECHCAATVLVIKL